MAERGVKLQKKQKEDARDLAIKLLACTKRAQFDRWIAEDIVEECEHVIREVKYCGRTDYANPEEVVHEFLGLSEEYAWIFLPE